MGLKVKFFGSSNPFKTSFLGKESFSEQLEKDINIWLMKKPNIEIIEIKQSAFGGSFAPAKVFISIWYKEKS